LWEGDIGLPEVVGEDLIPKNTYIRKEEMKNASLSSGNGPGWLKNQRSEDGEGPGKESP